MSTQILFYDSLYIGLFRVSCNFSSMPTAIVEKNDIKIKRASRVILLKYLHNIIIIIICIIFKIDFEKKNRNDLNNPIL